VQRTSPAACCSFSKQPLAFKSMDSLIRTEALPVLCVSSKIVGVCVELQTCENCTLFVGFVQTVVALSQSHSATTRWKTWENPPRNTATTRPPLGQLL
jgi:hypothetical protein